MTFSEFAHYFPDTQVTIQQALACHYLERAGQRFCVDFGYDNAIEKARAIKRQAAANRHLMFTRASSDRSTRSPQPEIGDR